MIPCRSEKTCVDLPEDVPVLQQWPRGRAGQSVANVRSGRALSHCVSLCHTGPIVTKFRALWLGFLLGVLGETGTHNQARARRAARRPAGQDHCRSPPAGRQQLRVEDNNCKSLKTSLSAAPAAALYCRLHFTVLSPATLQYTTWTQLRCGTLHSISKQMKFFHG